MNYIYGYRNKINNKWYVGQTTMSLEERDRTHISGATHEKASDYNCLFHQKLREYGRNNFELIILEEVPNKEDLDSKECYWIQQKHSFVKDNGYNLTTGGQQRKDNENYIDIRQKFQTNEQIQQVISEIQDSTIKLVDIANKYQVSLSLICSINTGVKYHDDNLNYPLRPLKNKITEDMVELIIKLLQDNLSNHEIGTMLGIDPDVVYKINYGKAHRKLNLQYPIRQEKSARELRADEIKRLLKENKLNNKQIAEQVHCDPSVVSNINYGKNYKDENLSYPIRKS